MGKFVDLTGQIFDRLTVIEKTDKRDSNGSVIWLCRCACTNEILVKSNSLTSGHTKSCGCINKERASEFCKTHFRTHNLRTHRLYNTWEHMKQRCYNKNNKDYKNYGARGIIVCNEWLDDFMIFYSWAISNGYRDDLTLDRVNVNGNYEPNNCRWATQGEQNNNKQSHHKLTYNGETLTLAQWSERVNIPYNTLERRINKHKWSTEKTLTTPVRHKSW